MHQQIWSPGRALLLICRQLSSCILTLKRAGGLRRGQMAKGYGLALSPLRVCSVFTSVSVLVLKQQLCHKTWKEATKQNVYILENLYG